MQPEREEHCFYALDLAVPAVGRARSIRALDNRSSDRRTSRGWKMVRPQHLLIAIALILLPLIADSALACQCLERQPPCADYWQAEAVFVGTVTEISPTFDDFESSLRTKNRRVWFSLEKSYRGVKGNEIILENWINSCEYQFEKGKKYFVYAYRNAEDGSLGTHGCSRTTEASRASEDLAYIQAFSVGKSNQGVSGVIQRDRYTPIKGVKVVASGKGKRFQSISNSEGRFKIVIPEAGKYKVRIFLPRQSSVGGPQPQIEKISNVVTTKKHTIVEYDLEMQSGRCEFLVVPALIEKDGT